MEGIFVICDVSVVLTVVTSGGRFQSSTSSMLPVGENRP